MFIGDIVSTNQEVNMFDIQNRRYISNKYK